MAITFGTETVFRYTERLKLDKKDTKIIYELYKNARVPVSIIAKKVGLSKDTIKYRMRRMEQRGLILGYTAVINMNRLGYHWNILLLQTKFENLEKENAFIEFLQSSKNVLKVMKCSGKWDYQFDVIFSSLLEFNDLIKKIKELTLLLDFSVLNCLKEIKYAHVPPVFFRDLRGEFVQTPAGRVDESKEALKLDDTDLHIIKSLVKNSRISLLEISKTVRLSPDATNNRIKRLEKKQILFGCIPVINTALLFDEHWIFVQTSTLPPAFLSYLKQHKNIQALYETGYQYDLFFWISTTSIGEYEVILSEIKRLFSHVIIRIDSALALREYKYTEFPDVAIEGRLQNGTRI